MKHALEPDVEHGVPVVQEVNVQETVGLPDGLLVDGLQIALRQQRRELPQQAVLLHLVAQAPDHVELGVDADRVADQAELLRGDDGGDLEVSPADEQGVQGRISSLLVESGGVRMVVDNHQNLVELLHLELLARLGNLALLVDDPAQSGFIPVLEVYLLAIRRDLHHLFDVPLDRAPAVIDVDARAKNDDLFEAVAVLLQNHADERGGLPRLARTHKHPCHRQARNDGILRLLDLVGRRWKELDLPHRRFTFRDRKRRACIV